MNIRGRDYISSSNTEIIKAQFTHVHYIKFHLSKKINAQKLDLRAF